MTDKNLRKRFIVEHFKELRLILRIKTPEQIFGYIEPVKA